MIHIMPLLALAFKKQERVDEALTVLERAVDLARPGGWISPFVELGPPMAHLLKQLHKQNVAVDYIERLLAAFRGDEQAPVPDASDQDISSPYRPIPPSPSSHTPQPLIEPLTNRELEILELLAQRQQNKEIADKLFISTETVKSHLKNIYQKLQVPNRRQAVTTAKSLGLLSGR